MTFYNIANPSEKVTLRDAVFKSISNESGLYMPTNIPLLPDSFIQNLHKLSLQEIAFEVSTAMFGSEIESLKEIINDALNFEIPLKKIKENCFVLELFHGPTLAFKDVGARFMAGLFEYFLQNDSRKVTILVATSGDTGSAVANAFYEKKGINVVILYPSGKVSRVQEKQLTTMGGNIKALEVSGDFDDCQTMVKQAFADLEINALINLTSANSINFARLFPQTFYYFWAYAQLGKTDKKTLVSVPSGNFGNLTAGLIAKRMGLPIHRFIAATNQNHAIPDYLITGNFSPKATQHTITNAMDVGNANNFPRMLELYNNSNNAMQEDVIGHWCTDDETRIAMVDLQSNYQYQADPHGAVAFWGLKEKLTDENMIGVFLETAHPAKFENEVEKTTRVKVITPQSLDKIMNLPKNAIQIDCKYQSLRQELLKN